MALLGGFWLVARLKDTFQDIPLCHCDFGRVTGDPVGSRDRADSCSKSNRLTFRGFSQKHSLSKLRAQRGSPDGADPRVLGRNRTRCGTRKVAGYGSAKQDTSNAELLQALRESDPAVCAWSIEDVLSLVENDPATQGFSDEQIQALAQSFGERASAGLEDILAKRGNDYLGDRWDNLRASILAEVKAEAVPAPCPERKNLLCTALTWAGPFFLLHQPFTVNEKLASVMFLCARSNIRGYITILRSHKE